MGLGIGLGFRGEGFRDSGRGVGNCFVRDMGLAFGLGFGFVTEGEGRHRVQTFPP